MADLDPKLCAQVYVDWEYRKVWDTYVLGEEGGWSQGSRGRVGGAGVVGGVGGVEGDGAGC